MWARLVGGTLVESHTRLGRVSVQWHYENRYCGQIQQMEGDVPSYQLGSYRRLKETVQFLGRRVLFLHQFEGERQWIRLG